MQSPKTAIELGIGMVHQHFKLVNTLTVTENIYLAADNKCKFALNEREMQKSVQQFSEQYNLAVDASAVINQLSVGEQQRVEIVKLLFRGAELLILDEPTSVLTPQETEELFKTLRVMVEEGKTVLFITHKLYEVMEYSDRITVLRGGKSVGSMLTSETSQEKLVKLMVGRDVPPLKKERIPYKDKQPVLSMENVQAYGDKKTLALKGITLQVLPGEIFGIAGVAGNGQRELTEAIVGLREVVEGKILLDGEDISNCSVKQVMKKGVAYVPDDRMGTGLVGSMNMMENTILRSYDSKNNNSRGFLKWPDIRVNTERLVKHFEIKSAGLSKPVSLMSGGNLQKLLLGREISGNPKLIIAAYPVHGVDIGATHAIHSVLLEERAKGTAIILISEDLEELYKMSDQVGVLCDGKIVDVIPIEKFDYDMIGSLMCGMDRSACDQVEE